MVVSLALSVRPDSQPFPLERLFNSRTASYAIGMFAIGVAPVVEELVFRGLLFAILERAVGLRFAVVATAALFAGLHVPGILARLASHLHDFGRGPGIFVRARRDGQPCPQHHSSHRVQRPHHHRPVLFNSALPHRCRLVDQRLVNFETSSFNREWRRRWYGRDPG